LRVCLLPLIFSGLGREITLKFAEWICPIFNSRPHLTLKEEDFMKRVLIKIISFIVIIILSLCHTIQAQTKMKSDCSRTREVLEKLGEHFRKTDRSFFELTVQEREEFIKLAREYFILLRACEEEITALTPFKKSTSLLYHGFIGVLTPIPQKGFSLVYLGSYTPDFFPIIKMVFDPAPELFLISITPKVDQVFSKEKNLEKKPFCYIPFLHRKIICPYFRLEKDLTEEFPVIIKYEYSGEDRGKRVPRFYFNDKRFESIVGQEIQEMFKESPEIHKNSLELPYFFHEFTRTLIYWLNKEFGEKGRGLIRKRESN